jgi:16S rRNA (adenine1518-N6/adenine1519-N6)-dimethyltransferase
MTQPIASIKRVHQVLKNHGLHAKKHLGQNFIVDRNIINKIVSVANINDTSHVLEIGPGIGSLTEALCESAKTVSAVEIDSQMVNILKETCGDFDNLTLIHQDFLQFDLNTLDHQPITVCANLPYYVTTPILFKLFESDCEFSSIVVMVQKEVALRFKAQKDTKQYNALSIFAQTCFHVELAFDVSHHVFFPKPDVDSSILIFTRNKEIDPVASQPIFDFIKKCFVFRRKTLSNNLKEIVPDISKIEEYLKKADLASNIRAQSVEFDQFKKLYEVIYED